MGMPFSQRSRALPKTGCLKRPRHANEIGVCEDNAKRQGRLRSGLEHRVHVRAHDAVHRTTPPPRTQALLPLHLLAWIFHKLALYQFPAWGQPLGGRT